MAYIIQLERKAVKDIEELKKAGNKTPILSYLTTYSSFPPYIFFQTR